jgi:hypothetical protein
MTGAEALGGALRVLLSGSVKPPRQQLADRLRLTAYTVWT